ncbi:MAG: hypothetical protein K8S18_02860 [Desulfobacula sp.]|nr:hypothetical protein [Desulfobacula sp.]
MFVTSFIAATIVPASSAAILLAALAAGAPPVPSLIACSIGNSLGCEDVFWLGYLFSISVILSKENSKSGRKSI